MSRAAAVSILVTAVGAILAFAVVVSPVQHGFNINTVGAILMIVGIFGLALTLLFGLTGGVASRHDRDEMNQITGAAVASLLVAAVGAILAFAVVVSPVQHGFNINTVGIILIIVGTVGLALSLLFGLIGDPRRRQTGVEGGHGDVGRPDRYQENRYQQNRDRYQQDRYQQDRYQQDRYRQDRYS